MNKLLIVGSGGHGRVVADTAIACRQFERIAFMDDRYEELGSVMNLPVLGPISKTAEFITEFSDALVAIGDNRLRVQLLEFLKGIGFRIPCLIHPTAYVGLDTAIGEGTVMFANSVVNTGAYIGRGSIINTAATVDHDTHIEDGVHLSPGVHLAGDVYVGSCSWIGTGASIIPGVRIGSDVVVGAGAVVIRDIPDGVTVVGNPGCIILKGKNNG